MEKYSRKQLIEECLYEAGQVIRAAFDRKGSESYTVKADATIVTQVDTEVEKMLRAKVQSQFDQDRFLGEESGKTKGSPIELDSLVWVVDPLDGTTNFAKGIPYFCTSIAVWRKTAEGFVAELAGIYEPIQKHLFLAERGQGATLNGKLLPDLSKSKAEHGVAVTGLFDEQLFQDGRIKWLYDHCQSIRVFGAAALDLCYVATGVFDAAWFAKLNPWDFGAAYLVLLETGAGVELASPLDLGSPNKIFAGRKQLVERFKQDGGFA